MTIRYPEIRLKEADEKISAVWGELFPVLESEAAATRQYAEKGFMSLSDGQLDLKVVQMRFGINPEFSIIHCSSPGSNILLRKKK